DLAGREDLTNRLADLAADPTAPPIVLVTHHTEEIPEGFTHVLLLSDGRMVDAGSIDRVLTAEALSTCFSLPLRLDRRDGRWLSWSPRRAHATGPSSVQGSIG